MTNLKASAQALLPTLVQRAEEIDVARLLPADLAETLAQAGFFRMFLPRIYGGLELGPSIGLEAIETLAQGSASVAWCVMIGATTTINAAYLPEHHARTIWADPNVITGGVFAPRGTATLEGDHYRVNGQWAWGSGSANCSWLVGGAIVKTDQGPQARMMWFERDQVELVDTWHAMGLKGTGSGDLVVKDALVPIDRTVSLSDAPLLGGPLYAFPAFGLLAISIAAVALGNARGAINDLLELAGAKVPTGSKRPLAERAYTQIEVAKADAALRAAHSGLYAVTDAAYENAQETGELTLKERADLRLAACHAVRVAADVTRAMHELAGGTSAYLNCPIQRRFRDAHVATQHVMVGTAAMELAGRVLLGVEADFSQL